MVRSRSGFTIVELLIVIVVIAILATISIVAYNGIQQRATNVSIITAVSQSSKIISAYIAANGTYPLIGGGNSCLLPSQSGSCTSSGTNASINATLAANLSTLGQLPTSLPDARPEYSGIIYSYNSTRTFNNVLQPVMLFYSLKGNQQQCGLPNVASSGDTAAVSTTNGWTGSGGGYTVCFVSITGP